MSNIEKKNLAMDGNEVQFTAAKILFDMSRISLELEECQKLRECMEKFQASGWLPPTATTLWEDQTANRQCKYSKHHTGNDPYKKPITSKNDDEKGKRPIKDSEESNDDPCKKPITLKNDDEKRKRPIKDSEELTDDPYKKPIALKNDDEKGQRPIKDSEESSDWRRSYVTETHDMNQCNVLKLRRLEHYEFGKSSKGAPSKRAGVPRRHASTNSQHPPEFRLTRMIAELIEKYGKPCWLFEKLLHPTDVNRGQSRLSLPKLIVQTKIIPLLIGGEIPRKGFSVVVYDEDGKKFNMRFALWSSKTYVLNRAWNTFLEAHGLRAEKDYVTAWIFQPAPTRSPTENLRFIITIKRG